MVKQLLKQIPLMQDSYDRFLRTLSNKTRLLIINSLREKPKNVTQLTNELGIHQTSVSHALKRLLDCGFIYVEKRGKERIYELNNETIEPLLKLMETHIGKYCKDCEVK